VAQAFDDRVKHQPPTGTHQIDLDALLGGVIEAQFQHILSSSFIGDHVDHTYDMEPRNEANRWSFGFKPLAPTHLPVAPNSVFQLSQFMGMRANA
jgi:hypothetical protein